MKASFAPTAVCVCVAAGLVQTRPAQRADGLRGWGCRGTREEEIQGALKVRAALASPAPQSGRVDDAGVHPDGLFLG